MVKQENYSPKRKTGLLVETFLYVPLTLAYLPKSHLVVCVTTRLWCLNFRVIRQSASAFIGSEDSGVTLDCRDAVTIAGISHGARFSFVFGGDGEFDAEVVMIKRSNLELARWRCPVPLTWVAVTLASFAARIVTTKAAVKHTAQTIFKHISRIVLAMEIAAVIEVMDCANVLRKEKVQCPVKCHTNLFV